MQYAFLIYTEESLHRNMTQEQASTAINNNLEIIGDATERGVFRGMLRLTPTSESVTARRQLGQLSFTDGPFTETKEILGGFYLMECKDESEARYWAERLTKTGCSTAVEFRPVADVYTLEESTAKRAEAALATG